VSLAERGRIFGNEPRAYPFGMLELSKPLLNDRFQLQVKTSLTSPSSR
jgi:hypothetical protein